MKKKKAVSGAVNQPAEGHLSYEEIRAIEDYIFSLYKEQMDVAFLRNGFSCKHTYEQSHAEASVKAFAGDVKEGFSQEEGNPGERISSAAGENSFWEKNEAKVPEVKAVSFRRPPMESGLSGKEKMRYLLEPHMRACGYSEKDLLRLAGEKAAGFEKLTVTKNRLLKFCLIAHMDTAETEKLLAAMSYDFPMTVKRNQIVSYYLEKKLGDLFEVNQALLSFGEMPI